MLKHLALILPVGCLCAGPLAANPDPAEIVADHALPRYAALAESAERLESAAERDCAPTSPDLRDAWAAAFDDWISVSHLRFGPSEEDERAFALAFWPDSRGITPRTLSSLIAEADPVVESPDAFAEVSIAARGFYAMEFLLYDPAFDAPPYTCALTRAIATDISRISDALLDAWQTGFAEEFDTSSARYADADEALKELFTALTSGLQFTAATRLGRPLGSVERPRPNRAEARRSERSLRHVRLSLEATEDLAMALAADTPEVAARIEAAYARAYEEIATQDSPVFAGVTDPAGRFRVEILQQSIDELHRLLNAELGPALGLAAGFNSLDGD